MLINSNTCRHHWRTCVSRIIYQSVSYIPYFLEDLITIGEGTPAVTDKNEMDIT